jgi:hypothetical protein
MPWTAKDAKRFKKGLTSAQAAKWAKIANAALASCQARGGSDCEGYAIRTANSKFAWEECGWDWADIIAHDDHFDHSNHTLAPKDDRKKPGGSNAGKYKKGPFCGPSGGAPKGTYPVNTRGRAIAAIAYARHAPNPSGIKSCVCRHWPSLAACKKKKTSEGTMSEEKLPKGALRFVDTGCHAHVEFADMGEGEKRIPKLRMIGYSGGIIKGHWYWNNLAIDLNGIKFKQSKYPVLEEHLGNRKVAVISKPKIEDGKLVAPENAKFLRTEAAQDFLQNSEDGFPYQSSIYAKPSNVERLEEGTTAEVNGFTMKGPGTIWRECEFKEMSVCVFGWDSKTQASAFSRDEYEDVSYTENEILADCDDCGETETTNKLKLRKEVSKIMDLEQLKKEHPELVQAIIDETQEKFGEDKQNWETEKSDLEAANEQLKADNEKLKAENEDQEDRLLKLEKKDLIRTENEFKANADKIWSEKLSKSEVPDNIWDKIRQYVKYSKFVEDGKFDQEAFAEAVDAEIKDWEERGLSSSKVLGSGSTDKQSASEGGQEDESVKEDVNRMRQHVAGHKPAE